MFLNNFIIGIAEDVTGYFVYPNFYDLFNFNVLAMYGYPHGIPHSIFSYSEPGVLAILFLLARYFNTIIVFNLFVLVMTVITIFCSYKLFNLFSISRALSFGFSVVVICSPYFIYHSRSHPQLIQIWLPILFFYFLFVGRVNEGLNNDQFGGRLVIKYRNYILGIILGLSILSSNYLGFFLLIFITSFYFFEVFLNRRSKESLLIILKEFFVLIGIGAFISAIWFVSFYFNQSALTTSGDLGQYSRKIDDFVTFSSRPWYYFLPSTDNPFLGSYSQSVIDFLQNKWGYYLTQNYYKDEHSSSYLGFVSIVFSLIGFYRIKKEWSININKSRIFLSLFLTEILLILFSLPPYFTLAGYKILMPSYLLFLVFPMFRTLSRIGIYVFVINAIFAVYGVSYFLRKIKNRFILILIPALISAVFLFEVFVPIKISLIHPIPEFVVYLKSLDSGPISVYPYKYTSYMFFWMKDYGKPLVNPRDFKYQGFDSKLFTANLNTCIGLKEAQSLGTKYIVEITNDSEIYFSESKNLRLIKTFEQSSLEVDSSNWIFSVVDLRAHPNIRVFELVGSFSCE